MGLFDSLFGGGGKKTKVTVPPVNLAPFDAESAISRNVSVNRPDQFTPFGNLTYEGPDRNTLRFALSPELQALFAQQTGFGTEAAGTARGMLSAIPQSGDAATQALIARMQPSWTLDEQRLRDRLEQSGNPAAYGAMDMAPGAFNELALQRQGQNDARLAAILAGPQYQGQLIQNAAGLANSSPIGVPQYQFQGPGQLDVTSPLLARYQGQLQTALQQQQLALQAGVANAQNAQNTRSGILGGLFDLGSAFIGLNPWGWGTAAPAAVAGMGV